MDSFNMSEILYPDNGNPCEDAGILRNAVNFSTAARVFSAQLVTQQPLNVRKMTLRFLVVKAFEEYMTSTEDMLGWLFALIEWKPGDPEFCLFRLIDKIQVGRQIRDSDYSEDKAKDILSKLDVVGFRKLFHIPESTELLSIGKDEDFTNRIERSLIYKLDGWQHVANQRATQNRGLVHMFNKCKHHMYAFPTNERGKEEIWMPTSIELEKEKKQFNVGRGWIEVNADLIRKFVGDAIAAQALLHDTLAIILTTRYKEEYSPPEWLLKVLESDHIFRE
jgi:hypothetical protein